MDTQSAIRFQRYITVLNKIRTNYNITPKRSSSSTALDLAHRIHGPSPTPNSVPIVVLHGFLGSKRNWESICKKMTAYTNKAVIAVDARNHGDSPHSASHTYDDLAGDVSKLISKFSISKAIVIGHSMGGRTGMLLALKEPSKVSSLIVVDISPVSTASGLGDFFPRAMAVMETVDFRGMNTLIKARTAAKDTITKSGLFDNEQGMYFILMNVGKLSDNSFGWKCNLDALKKNFRNVASFPSMNKKHYRGPTLFVGGKLSYFIPPEDITGIRKLFPKAHLHYIEGVGHNVHAEDPNAFFTTLYIAASNKISTNFNIIPKRSSSSTSLDLAHKIHGPSPTPDSVPIVVLHGLLGSKRNWESICKKMTAYTNKAVIAVDARNHGDSPHSASHTYDDLAGDVSILISKFSISKAIVIGHSMGGRTGMLLALKEPSKVAGLVVVDISPVSTASVLGDFSPRVMAAMETVDFRGMDTLNKARTAAKDTITNSGLFKNEHEMYFILMNIGKLSNNSFGWKCNLDALKKNFRYVASFPKMNKQNYRGPTLFVGGKLSYFIPPDDITGIRKLFPKAHLHYIEGVGHNVHAEDPNAFFNTVMQFFSYTAMNQAQI